jgi:nucleoside-diphosphate-sugar epimerase
VKVLISGADGFIGTWLRQVLVQHGHEVIGIDIADGDLRHAGIADTLVRVASPDVVVHLAAAIGRLWCEDDVAYTISENALMTTNVAKAAAAWGARMVYASTSEIYGDNGDMVCFEESGPFSLPKNLYGLSKLWGEDICRMYCPEHLQIVRPNMPFGPGVPPGRGRAAIHNYLWWANTKQDIIVHEGSERAWCFISDTVTAIRAVIESGEMALDAEDSRNGIGVYNIGRMDTTMPMEQIAQIACGIAGASESLIKVVPVPGLVSPVKRLSDAKLRKLGWVPEMLVEDGMKITFEFLQLYDRNGMQCESPMAAQGIALC